MKKIINIFRYLLAFAITTHSSSMLSYGLLRTLLLRNKKAYSSKNTSSMLFYENIFRIFFCFQVLQVQFFLLYKVDNDPFQMLEHLRKLQGKVDIQYLIFHLFYQLLKQFQQYLLHVLLVLLLFLMKIFLL